MMYRRFDKGVYLEDVFEGRVYLEDVIDFIVEVNQIETLRFVLYVTRKNERLII